MATVIEMPQMGFDMQEGTVVKWRKSEGDQVARGEVIAEIETDKAVVEMEAYASGLLKKILVEEGKRVPVGTLIGVITAPDEALPPLDTLQSKTTAQAPADGVRQATAPAPSRAPEAAAAGAEVKASPIARRLAKEMGVDLAQIKGTGPGGRVTEADVKSQRMAAPPAATAAKALPAEAQRVPLSRMRQAIANTTIRSNRDVPHFYVTGEIDMGKAMDMRRDMNDGLPQGVRVSVNDFIIKACALAIGKYPNFNASYQEGHLLLSPHVNIGIAIALEQGLIIASILDCQSRDLVNIGKASKDLIDRAHGGTLKAEEYIASTFTISNLGMYDVDSFSAIIYPPNAAVLAVGSVKEQPVVRDGQITIGRIMKATISVDHRVVDGAEAAQFLREVKRLLEHPAVLLL